APLRRSMAAARRGSVDGVHDVRTNARRLRTVLAAHGDEVPDERADPLRARLRALRRAAGAARDLDVLAATLRGEPARGANPAGIAALLEAVAARRAEARSALAAYPLSRFAKDAGRLQDALGAVQDAIAQREALRGMLAGHPSADARAGAAAQAAAAVSDALEKTGRKGRKRAAKLLSRAYGEKALRSLGD